jgi:predicted nucleic acid-binding protein
MICFDTTVLIWGVQGSARGGAEIVDRTRRYIDSLAKDNERIMIPTPAVTEYLQVFGPDDRRRQLEILARHFVIQAFDLPSAFLAADIAYKTGAPKVSKDVTRQAVKTDIEILATALVHGASSLITDNKRHFDKLAVGRHIKISEVPTVAEQRKLFEP